MQEKRYKELDFFNAIACLGVILIHVLSIGIADLEKTSWQFAVIFFPHQLAAFVVPGFLFVSAVKMSVGFSRETNYRSYLWKRVKQIYIPYIIAVAIYYLVFMRIGYVSGNAAEFFHYLVTGTLSSPFYYVLIAMQFYILAPLWKKLVRAIPWYVMIPCAYMLSALMLNAEGALNLAGITFGYMDRVFPTYMLFWALGLYVGAHYDMIRARLSCRKPAVLPALLCVLIFVFLVYIQQARGIYLYAIGYLKLVSDSLCILLLLTLCILLNESANKWLAAILTKIHSASFFVYLSHCLFLTVGTVWMQERGVTDFAALLLFRAIICYTLPFAVYFLYGGVRTTLHKIRAA